MDYPSLRHLGKDEQLRIIRELLAIDPPEDASPMYLLGWYREEHYRIKHMIGDVLESTGDGGCDVGAGNGSL